MLTHRFPLSAVASAANLGTLTIGPPNSPEWDSGCFRTLEFDVTRCTSKCRPHNAIGLASRLGGLRTTRCTTPTPQITIPAFSPSLLCYNEFVQREFLLPIPLSSFRLRFVQNQPLRRAQRVEHRALCLAQFECRQLIQNAFQNWRQILNRR